jgi:hypothetical protein
MVNVLDKRYLQETSEWSSRLSLRYECVSHCLKRNMCATHGLNRISLQNLPHIENYQTYGSGVS